MYNKPDHQQLYEIAENQAGYFSARQAISAGFSRERLSYYVSTGKYIRVRPGVYRLVQFPGSKYEDLFIAWLQSGPDSVISHESALSIYDLSDALPGETHVIVPRTASRRQKGIRHHTNRLRSDEISSREGLSLTTVARTIADCAASHLPEEQVHQAIREAITRGMVTPDELYVQAKRQKGRARRIIEEILERENWI